MYPLRALLCIMTNSFKCMIEYPSVFGPSHPPLVSLWVPNAASLIDMVCSIQVLRHNGSDLTSGLLWHLGDNVFRNFYIAEVVLGTSVYSDPGRIMNSKIRSRVMEYSYLLLYSCHGFVRFSEELGA